MPFDLGATARLTAECRDPGGTLATAATAVVTVTLPDDTTATPAVTETSTGLYQADYVTTMPGRHTVRWGWTSPAHAYTDVFDVQEAAPPAILSLADAKKHVNITGTRDDDELRFWNNATTRAVEFYTGPVIARSVTEDHDVGRTRVLALRQVPALSLTTVAAVLDSGTSYAVADLDLDGDTGIVRRKDGGWLCGPLRATYTAGRASIRENITAGARIILEHLWRTQRAGRRGGLAGGGDDYSVTEPIPGLGYAVPNRAVELLAPDRLPPGVA
ncbi:hypothetical protein [Streptomyces sp. NPDC002845]